MMTNTAIAYTRVSSKTQLTGTGLEAQEKQIRKYAQNNDIEIINVFKEKGISGTIENRPALMSMLIHLENNPDINLLLIDRYDRISRELMIQENILNDLNKLGVQVDSISEDIDSYSDDHTRILMRQIMGSISQYDKAKTVARLAYARQLKKSKIGKCGGRKSLKEMKPAVWKEIKRLNKKPKNKQKRTLQEIADILNSKDMTTSQGATFNRKNLSVIIKLNGGK